MFNPTAKPVEMVSLADPFDRPARPIRLAEHQAIALTGRELYCMHQIYQRMAASPIGYDYFTPKNGAIDHAEIIKHGIPFYEGLLADMGGQHASGYDGRWWFLLDHDDCPAGNGKMVAPMPVHGCRLLAFRVTDRSYAGEAEYVYLPIPFRGDGFAWIVEVARMITQMADSISLIPAPDTD